MQRAGESQRHNQTSVMWAARTDSGAARTLASGAHADVAAVKAAGARAAVRRAGHDQRQQLESDSGRFAFVSYPSR